MSECKLHEYLTAYHDGELDPEASRRFEMHLDSCPACTADLRIIREISTRIAGAGLDGLDRPALDRMHAALDDATAEDSSRFQILRTAGYLSALAASVLIISGVWLLQLPSGQPRGQVAVGPRAIAPEWEHIATNLRADPRPDLLDDSPLSPRYAAAVDWMLSRLTPTERKPWVKPNSL